MPNDRVGSSVNNILIKKTLFRNKTRPATFLVVLMKKILVLSSFLALGSFAKAQEAPAAEKCPAKKCPDACAAACGDGTMIKLAVTGLDNDVAAETAKATLDALAGISSCQSCDKSNTVTIMYDPEKMKVAEIEKMITASGLKIKGHQTSFKIAGLACQSCSNHLTAVLGKTEGVVNVDKVCHMSGHAAVTFDPKKTDAAKIKATIHTTKYKVVEAAAKPAPVIAPQS
ncbi:MAG: copper chaperone CopZ [Akkermansiaceae bacterium]